MKISDMIALIFIRSEAAGLGRRFRAAQRGVPRAQSVDASFIKTFIVNEPVKIFPICEVLLNGLVSGFHLLLTHLLKTVFSMNYR